MKRADVGFLPCRRVVNQRLAPDAAVQSPALNLWL